MAKKKDDSKRVIRAIRRKRVKPPREFEDGTVGRTRAWTDWGKTKKRNRRKDIGQMAYAMGENSTPLWAMEQKPAKKNVKTPNYTAAMKKKAKPRRHTPR